MERILYIIEHKTTSEIKIFSSEGLAWKFKWESNNDSNDGIFEWSEPLAVKFVLAGE